MKKITFALAVLITVCLPQITKSQDTLVLKRNFYFLNSESQLPHAKDVELDSENIKFKGFLIIKIDEKSKYIKDSDSYEVKIFFVNNLKDFFNSRDIFYYNQVFYVFMDWFNEIYDEGTINKLTSFMHFYKIFAEANSDSLEMFLYKGNDEIGTNDIYDYKDAYKKNNEPNSYYFIYRLDFDAAVLIFRIGNEEKKTLIPISHLKLFRNLYLYEFQNTDFSKANVVLKLE